jgi:acyl-CoA synthetase (AMP-forming)/AMP-acid ligase II/acyl carrier protein
MSMDEGELETLRGRVESFTRARTIGELVLERARGDAPLLARLAMREPARGVRLLSVGDDHPPGVVPDEADGSIELDWHGLHVVASRAAACLDRRGVRAGDRVLLVLRTGTSFVAAFLGCQLVGAVPVAVVPPWSSARREAHLERIGAIACKARATAVVLGVESEALLSHGPKRLPSDWRPIHATELLHETASFEGPPPSDEHAPAFLQFTSGSTGRPKGVIVSHRALLANIVATGAAHGFGLAETWCTWLPLFHDMGLVAYFLGPILRGGRTVLIPPDAFLQQPSVWLEAISRYRVTASGGQDFGYRLAAERISDDAARRLDLSCWRWAVSGGELNRALTQRSFADRFARCGFSPASFVSAYGLAEMCLAVTTTRRGSGVRVDRIDRVCLEEERRIVDSRALNDRAPDDRAPARAMEVASVGRPIPGHEVRVVDPRGMPVAERIEGEIEVRGPSMMTGYYEDTDATDDALRQGWLRTGDLGYLSDGELFITGRRKEIVIKAGRNIHPYDVERAAEVSGVRAGRCAAFGVPDPSGEVERLVVVCETRETGAAAHRRLARSVRTEVVARVGISPDEVVLAPPGTVRKTPTGKIQRVLARNAYLRGELAVCGPAHTSAQRNGRRSRDDVMQIVCRSIIAVGAAAELMTGDIREEQSLFADLGLSSLELLELTVSLESALGVELPMQQWVDEQGVLTHSSFRVGSLVEMCLGAAAVPSERGAE